MQIAKDLRFLGRTALVTGASEGIGYAVAAALVAAGAKVVLTGRREDALAEATRRLGPAASSATADVSEPEAMRQVVGDVVACRGGLDLLVCNAGVLIPGDVIHQPAADSDRVIDVNLRGTIGTVQAAVGALAVSGNGAIVVITSSIGRKPAAGMGVYGATKAALNYLVPTWAMELASQGIRVNGVCAGITDTPGLRTGALAIPGLEQAVIATNLIKRIAAADEIAGPVLTLLDSTVSGFVTGSVWDIDGGYMSDLHGSQRSAGDRAELAHAAA